MPSKMHMTVPINFRRRSGVPKILHLHFGSLKNCDIEQRQGFKVTTPTRTLIDIIEVKTVPDEIITQATFQALERGLILKKELKNFEMTHPDVYVKIMDLLND